VVVGDFDVLGGTIGPHKADAPLVVDANAVLSGPVAYQGVAVITTDLLSAQSGQETLENQRQHAEADPADHPFDDAQFRLQGGDIHSDRLQFGLEDGLGYNRVMQRRVKGVGVGAGLILGNPGGLESFQISQFVECHGAHRGSSSAGINIGGLTGDVKGGMVVGGGVETSEDSVSGRHPESIVAFFMPGDRPAHVPLWREGEEYNTRKGNNSARSLPHTSLPGFEPPATSMAVESLAVGACNASVRASA